MLVLRLRGEDVAAVRFAISPLNEVVASLIRRRRRGLNPATSPWETEVDALLATEDTTLLDLLVSPRGWAPDVLTPFPDGPEARFDEEFDAVRRADPGCLRADFDAAYAAEPLPEELRRRLRSPARLLEDIVVALERYVRLAIEPRWPRIRSAIEADISARTHLLARKGLGAMLGDLQPQVAWDGRSLRVAVAPEIDHAIDLAGRSLPLSRPSSRAIRTSTSAPTSRPSWCTPLVAPRWCGTTQSRHPLRSRACWVAGAPACSWHWTRHARRSISPNCWASRPERCPSTCTCWERAAW
jgi:hypothetical protein